jgi:hypothetical protein
MFSDQDEQQAREDLYSFGVEEYDICGWPNCSVRVPRGGNMLCLKHQKEADEDAMDDMLDAAGKYPVRVLNHMVGHLAASSISGRDYFCACRLLQSCIYETHFRVGQ